MVVAWWPRTQEPGKVPSRAVAFSAWFAFQGCLFTGLKWRCSIIHSGWGGRGPASSDLRPVQQSGKSALTSYNLGCLSKPLHTPLISRTAPWWELSWRCRTCMREMAEEQLFLANTTHLPSFYCWLKHIVTRNAAFIQVCAYCVAWTAVMGRTVRLF